ncbi:MAG: hypothetical protein QW727_01335 [Candidatus Pacearchaeota archaeon]
MEYELVNTAISYTKSFISNPSAINVIILTSIGMITYYLSKKGKNYLERKEREMQCRSLEDKIDGE